MRVTKQNKKKNKRQTKTKQINVPSSNVLPIYFYVKLLKPWQMKPFSHSAHSHGALKFQNCLLLRGCWTNSPRCWYPDNRKHPSGEILVLTVRSSLQPTYCPPLHKSPFLFWPSLCCGDPCPAASITSQLTSAPSPVVLRTMREESNFESFSQSTFHPLVSIKQIISYTVFFFKPQPFTYIPFLSQSLHPSLTHCNLRLWKQICWMREASWHEPDERR